MQFNQSIKAFYNEQNIQIRKEIRELDMILPRQSIKNEPYNKPQLNILVTGLDKSGKSSLIKTLHFALNSNWDCPQEISEMGVVNVKKFEIKKSKKYQVEGLTKIKQTDQKRTITAYQIQSNSNKIEIKYSKSLQLIDNRMISCLKQISFQSLVDTNIRICLLCIGLSNNISPQEQGYIKYFLSQLREKGMKVLIILTNIDILAEYPQKEKLIVLDTYFSKIMKKFDIGDRNDIICVQNYTIFRQGESQNSQQINYYALKLIQRCIKESQLYYKYIIKGKKSLKGWFCS